jgi:hypothetical protein
MLKRLFASAVVLATSASLTLAQEVKVGVVLPYTGIGAELGQQIDRGMELYLKLNADKIKPYTIKLIKRDDKNPGGADSKVVTQELLTQDNVDALAGWVYSPNAIASAPVVAAGKKLAVLMNAGTAHITNMAPQYVRTAFSMWHSGHALGEAAARQLGAKTAVVGYTDFPPGKDSLAAFKRAFEASGGKVIDEIPMGGPGAVPDFTPFFQRAKDKKPDVFFVFVPAGDHATAVARTFNALGMKEAAGDGRGRRRPHLHASLQRRSRQSREQALRRSLEEGIRPQLHAGLHGGRRLRRDGGDRARDPGDQGQDGPRRRARLAEGLEVRQPARSDHDRPRNARHHHERIPVRSGDEGRPAVHEADRQDRCGEGHVQGREDRPLRAEIARVAGRDMSPPLPRAAASPERDQRWFSGSTWPASFSADWPPAWCCSSSRSGCPSPWG